MWETCGVCGSIVADPDTHATWHATVDPVADDTDPIEE